MGDIQPMNLLCIKSRPYKISVHINDRVKPDSSSLSLLHPKLHFNLIWGNHLKHSLSWTLSGAFVWFVNCKQLEICKFWQETWFAHANMFPISSLEPNICIFFIPPILGEISILQTLERGVRNLKPWSWNQPFWGYSLVFWASSDSSQSFWMLPLSIDFPECLVSAPSLFMPLLEHSYEL